MTCPRCSGALASCDSDWLLACGDCGRRWPPPANLVRELAEARARAERAEAALAEAATYGDTQRRKKERAWTERDAAEARASRLRSRLARVLRLVALSRDWVGIPCGGVWSRNALPPPPPNKETRRE